MARKRVAVLISGRGSNMQALIEAATKPDFPAEIALVVSNVPGAPGLARAEAAAIKTQTVNHRDFNKDRVAFETALDQRLREADIELVCNAGFMRVLTAYFVDRWRDRQLNIHPSLLPAFPGLDTHARALAAGARQSGCTVHFVRTEVDAGPFVVQASVPVLPGDDEAALAARVLTAEHKAYPLALELVASGRAQVVGETVQIDGKPGPLRLAASPETGFA
jgi:phosphoribosylglycinamide formyltransferase-1